MSLILGTAQIGQKYGILNSSGPLDTQKTAALVASAWKNGITTIDTAHGYGDSERILGEVLPHDAKIITKISVGSQGANILHDMRHSLENLKRSSIYAVLLHNTDCLETAEGEKIWQKMCNLKNSGLVEKIGLSVYTPDEYLIASDKIHIDIVQFPCNLLDQRFLRKDIQKKLEKQKTERHARSLFLQGVLLHEKNNLPAHFNPYLDVFSTIDINIKEFNFSRLEFCMAFAHAHTGHGFDHYIVGTDNVAQLEQILNALNTVQKFNISDWTHLATLQPDLIDPRLWKTG